MRLSDAETKQRLAQSEPASVKTAGREIVALTWQTDRNDAGTKHLKFTVDAEGKITEKSPPGKDNNSLDYTLEIGPMAHDLVIASVTLEPPVPVDGDPATLKVVVEDRARFPGVTLEGVRVKVFEGLQGFLLGESDSVAIHSQGKTTLAIDLDTGGLAGRRDLRIVVDPDQQIDEITPEGQDGENNNDRVVKVTIAE
jgi:hypothetical protein